MLIELKCIEQVKRCGISTSVGIGAIGCPVQPADVWVRVVQVGCRPATAAADTVALHPFTGQFHTSGDVVFDRAGFQGPIKVGVVGQNRVGLILEYWYFTVHCPGRRIG